MKNWIKKAWNSIKEFVTKKALPWIKKNWGQVVNLFVLFVGYDKLDEFAGAQTVVGLWIFFLLAYYIFWKLLKVESWFKK